MLCSNVRPENFYNNNTIFNVDTDGASLPSMADDLHPNDFQFSAPKAKPTKIYQDDRMTKTEVVVKVLRFIRVQDPSESCFILSQLPAGSLFCVWCFFVMLPTKLKS